MSKIIASVLVGLMCFGLTAADAPMVMVGAIERGEIAEGLREDGVITLEESNVIASMIKPFTKRS